MIMQYDGESMVIAAMWLPDAYYLPLASRFDPVNPGVAGPVIPQSASITEGLLARGDGCGTLDAMISHSSSRSLIF